MHSFLKQRLKGRKINILAEIHLLSSVNVGNVIYQILTYYLEGGTGDRKGRRTGSLKKERAASSLEGKVEERRSPVSYLSVLATNPGAKQLLCARITNSSCTIGWRDICCNFLMLNF